MNVICSDKKKQWIINLRTWFNWILPSPRLSNKLKASWNSVNLKNQCTVTEIQLILEIYPQTPSTLVKSYFFGISYVYIFDVDFAINFDILLAKTRASYEEKGWITGALELQAHRRLSLACIISRRHRYYNPKFHLWTRNKLYTINPYTLT